MPQDIILNKIVEKVKSNLKIQSSVKKEQEHIFTVEEIINNVTGFLNVEILTALQKDIIKYFAENVITFYSRDVDKPLLMFVVAVPDLLEMRRTPKGSKGADFIYVRAAVLIKAIKADLDRKNND